MDLRVLKTKKAIENTFLALRSKKDIEEIKVKDLCENAYINKTTFYNYYADIYELSDELENEAVEDAFNNCPNYNCMFSDSEKFIIGIYEAFNSSDKIKILFNNRFDILINKAEAKLLKAYGKFIDTEEKKMYTFFFIHGAFYILFNYKGDQKQKFKMLVNVANLLIADLVK